ncbi:hypothetical protein [Telluribacter humicola]|uniref:hypothetical protein n=1 Tax=Telluribacter humicola TaxID=1720261 RepID=UPI001A976739|nr:hypothetical protein [Telluribacter humicola]
MLELRNHAGLTLQLPPDSRITVEILSTILNTDEVLRGSYSYPFRFPLSPHNIRFLGVGYSPEQLANVEMPVTLAVDGMPVERGLMSFKIMGRYADAYLKLHLGEVASKVRELRLRQAVNEPFSLGSSEEQVKATLVRLHTADPATYPVVFPPFRNDLMIEPEYTTGRANYTRPTLFNRYQTNDGTLFFDSQLSYYYQYGERELVPMLYLTWLIRKICAVLGFTAVGSWLHHPEVERFILFNTQTVPGLNYATGANIELSQHVPDMSVGDFLKALRAFKGLGVFFDGRARQVRFVDYRTLRSSSQYQDFTDGFIPESDQYDQPDQGGYTLKNYVEETDELYKEVETFQLYHTVGDGEAPIDLQVGTLFMTRDPNYDSPANASWMIPVCKQPGNLGDPIFNASKNYSAYASGADPKNKFGLRLLSYRGMQADGAGALYPYASSVSYNFDYETVGTLSLMPGEPDDVFAQYQRHYYEMLAGSRKVQVDLLLSINQVSQFLPHVAVGLQLRNRIFSKWLPQLLSYELPARNSKVLAQLEAVQLVPVSLKPTIPQELLYQAVWVELVLENETVDDGSNFRMTYADVVAYFYEKGNKTNPVDILSLPVAYRQYTHTYQPNGSVTRDQNDLTVTASGVRFVLQPQAIIREEQAYEDPQNPQDAALRVVEYYDYVLLIGAGYRVIQ